MGWRFVIQPSNQTAKKGENVTLVCRPPRSRPTARVSWVKDSGPLAPLSVTPTGDLVFHRVQESDAGTYFCRASNDHLNRSVSSRSVSLTVLGIAPYSESAAPAGDSAPRGGLCGCSVRWGATLHPPSVGTRGFPPHRPGARQRNASLYFLSLRSYDEGTYTCEASNILGQDRRTATIRVTVIPAIVSFSGQVSSRLGAPAELPCRAVGVLPITSLRCGVRTQATTTVEQRTGRGETRYTPSSLSQRKNTNEELPAVQFNGSVLKNHSGMNPGLKLSDAHWTRHSQANLNVYVTERYRIRRTTATGPTSQPTSQPTFQPAQPTSQPTSQPAQPTSQPTSQPAQPTSQPTLHTPPSPTDRQLIDRNGPPPPIILPFSSPYSGSCVTSSRAAAGLRDAGLLATAVPTPHRSFGHSHLTKKTTARQLQHVVGETSTEQSGEDREVSHRRADALASPGVISAGLISFPESVFSPPRSLDATEPTTQFFTHRGNPATPVNRHGPDSVALSLALHATLRTSRPSFTASLYSRPQLQPPPTQGSTVEWQLAEDVRGSPEKRMQASLTDPNSEATHNPSRPPSTQSSFPQLGPELPLTSVYGEPQPPFTPTASPLPPPPKPESSSTPQDSPSPTGPLSSSQPEPQLPSIQPHGPFHSPPSVSAPTTTTTTITTITPTIIPTTTTTTLTTTTITTITPTTTTTTPTTTTITTTTPTPTTTTPTTTTITTTTPTPTTTTITTTTPTPTTTTPTTTTTTTTPTTTTPTTTTTTPTTPTTTITPTTTTTTTTPTPTTTTMADQLTSPSRTSVPKGPSPSTPAGPDGVRSDASQAADPAQTSGSTSDLRPTVGLKTNTSQSPMTSDDPRVTQKSPSWLPVLEKHDVPIVVGVGVSLAFIFITMAFYSLFQNNEPVPTNRAAQRNVGVPVRHAERQTPGKTYDNRAFEDDECVAVIEQSPNTADTRAQPLGPSLVMVQMEPPPEDLSENHQLSLLEDLAVPSVETCPLRGTLLDSQVDARVEEDKSFSSSPPSARLRCVEDWVTGSHPVCQEPPPSPLPPPFSLPPPLSSSLASHSPSPTISLCPSSPLPSSLATVREERRHSSLPFQTPAEPTSAASSHASATTSSTLPVHHSLSVSHAVSSPLLVSHHVSLGASTTVTVDVHFYAPATTAMAIATSTHINSQVSNTTPATGPLFNFPLANGQESDQSALRMPQSK
ncbi:Hemicentin-1 [Merluccius polli]|uniref:Hemicentin-1 n=1 Tax=Merluccius polli TaxID=89951 RepID=A0AA47MNX1_MERPO|nr:Hemicentin-1 [Merluccius polli]